MKTIRSSAVSPAVLAGYGIRTRVHITASLAQAMASTPMMTQEQRQDEVLIDFANFLAIDPGWGVPLMMRGLGGVRGTIAIRDRLGRGWLLAVPGEELPRGWQTDCLLPC
jgi:hypothetical protein